MSNFLVPDNELSPAEWLRRYALTKLKYGGEDKARVLELADYLEMTERVRDVMGASLERIANALKGPPEPDSLHGWEDLPELIEQLMKERGAPLPTTSGDIIQ